MNGNDFVSIVESGNEPTMQNTNKNSKIWVILTIVELVIIAVLACLLAMATIGGSSDVAGNDSESIADLNERKTYVIDNSDVFIAMWAAGKESGRLSKTSCEAVVALTAEYAKEYNTQALDANFCAANTIKVNVWVSQSEDYPFSEMRFMKIGNDNHNVILEMNSSFTLVNSYVYSQSTSDGATITIVKE